jgi:hypothetical protein
MQESVTELFKQYSQSSAELDFTLREVPELSEGIIIGLSFVSQFACKVVKPCRPVHLERIFRSLGSMLLTRSISQTTTPNIIRHDETKDETKDEAYEIS